MRVSTAFKRLLRLPGASIVDVCFAPEGVVVSVCLRRRRRVCALCGQTGGSCRSMTAVCGAGGTWTSAQRGV